MKEALKLALEALDYAGYLTEPEGDFGCNCLICQATAAVKEALAQPEQEPIGEPSYYAYRIERSLDDVADEYVSLHRSFLKETAQTIRGLTKKPGIKE